MFMVSRRKSIYSGWRFFKFIMYDKTFPWWQLTEFLCELSSHVARTNTLIGLTYRLCEHCFVLITNAYSWNSLEISKNFFYKTILLWVLTDFSVCSYTSSSGSASSFPSFSSSSSSSSKPLSNLSSLFVLPLGHSSCFLKPWTLWRVKTLWRT